MPEIDPRDHDTSRQRTQEIEGDMGGDRATVHCAWPCLLVVIMPLVFLNTTTSLLGHWSVVRDSHGQVLSGDLAHADVT